MVGWILTKNYLAIQSTRKVKKKKKKFHVYFQYVYVLICSFCPIGNFLFCALLEYCKKIRILEIPKSPMGILYTNLRDLDKG